MEVSISNHPSDCINDFLIRHQSDCVSLYYSFKCPGNDCGQNNAKTVKSNYHILLVSLAGTDVMTGALAQPLFVAVRMYRLSGSSASYKVSLLNNISTITSLFCITASILHLALLSVERYVTITYPYKSLELSPSVA